MLSKKNEETTTVDSSQQTPTQNDKKASEDSILGSMQGSVDLFIETYNDYFNHFPRLKSEAKYRKQSLIILLKLKKYVEKLEGELK